MVVPRTFGISKAQDASQLCFADLYLIDEDGFYSLDNRQVGEWGNLKRH